MYPAAAAAANLVVLGGPLEEDFLLCYGTDVVHVVVVVVVS